MGRVMDSYSECSPPGNGFGQGHYPFDVPHLPSEGYQSWSANIPGAPWPIAVNQMAIFLCR